MLQFKSKSDLNIPDTDWVDGERREVIEENLDRPVETPKTGDLI